MSSYKQKTVRVRTLQQRELLKAQYTENKKEALKILIDAEKQYKNETLTIDGGFICGFDYTELEQTKILNDKHTEISKFIEIQKRGFSYFGSAFDSYKLRLTVDIYVMDLIEQTKDDDIDKNIYNLIDKLVTVHKNIFNNNFLDTIFEGEYNGYISDKLQDEINKISKIEYEDIKETLTKRVKKPLKWNADKDTLGTLFALLYKAKIITGSKADLNRTLTTIFSNLKYDSIKKNLELSKSEKEAKIYHDTETIELVYNWIEYLKNQL
jgi:hypothetical protein